MNGEGRFFMPAVREIKGKSPAVTETEKFHGARQHY
jgi:hypothetical protein